jgi:hypothetical protein
MDDFTIDSAARTRDELEWQRKIQRAVDIEAIKDEVYLPLNVTIPYTPPVSVWKPNTATLRAFASNCFKSMMP